jgi:hypothetical protein
VSLSGKATSENRQSVVFPSGTYPPGVVGHPMAIPGGRLNAPIEVPNSHRIATRENDIETTPVTFNRNGVYWGTQLISGQMAIPRNWQRLSSVVRRAGWTNVVVPIEPGKMIGGMMGAGFPARGPSPSQVQLAFNQTAGNQPSYPGGPAQMVNGIPFLNPGTGALCLVRSIQNQPVGRGLIMPRLCRCFQSSRISQIGISAPLRLGMATAVLTSLAFIPSI